MSTLGSQLPILWTIYFARKERHGIQAIPSIYSSTLLKGFSIRLLDHVVPLGLKKKGTWPKPEGSLPRFAGWCEMNTWFDQISQWPEQGGAVYLRNSMPYITWGSPVYNREGRKHTGAHPSNLREAKSAGFICQSGLGLDRLHSVICFLVYISQPSTKVFRTALGKGWIIKDGRNTPALCIRVARKELTDHHQLQHLRGVIRLENCWEVFNLTLRERRRPPWLPPPVTAITPPQLSWTHQIIHRLLLHPLTIRCYSELLWVWRGHQAGRLI